MGTDYPEGRGRVRVEACGIAIEGVSIAGHESFYKLPGFRALLEFGRAPEDTVAYATMFLSHAHLDHAAGRPYASRRRLARLTPARVFAPREAVDDLASWLEACERLESIVYGVLDPAAPGESVTPAKRPRGGVPAGKPPRADRWVSLSRGQAKAQSGVCGRSRRGDRRDAPPGNRGDSTGGDPSSGLPRRLRPQHLRGGAGDPSRSGPSHRVLLRVSGGRRARSRLRASPSGRFHRECRPLRERGRRPDPFLAALPPRGNSDSFWRVCRQLWRAG